MNHNRKKEKIRPGNNKLLSDIKSKPPDEETELAESIINTVREPLLILDKDLRVVKANRSFFDYFRVNSEETIGALIYDLGNQQWDISELKELLEKILPEKTTFDNYEVEHDFAGIGNRILLLNARQIERVFGKEKIILLAIEDITERKHLEESLSETSRMTSEYLDILVNHAHVPIIIWDVSYIITRFNHAFEKLSGYDISEVIGRKIDFLFPEDKVNSTIELLKNSFGREKFEVIEIDILRKDKDIRTVLWNSANVFDKEGRIIVATIAQDITTRKRAAEAIGVLETRYRRLFESAKDGILILDAETGKIIDVNPFLVELLGYSHEKFTEKAIWEIGFFKDIADNENKFFELQQKDYVRYEDLPLETSDGRKINVEFVSNVYLVNNRRVIQCNIRDITERKQAEEVLQQERDFSRTIIQTSPTFFIAIGSDGKTILMNDSMLKTLGYTLSEVIGMDYLTKFIPVEDRENLSKIFEVLATTNKATVNENLILTKDGRKILVEWHGKNILKPNGELNYFFGIGIDITERKMAEEALQKSEERYRSLSQSAHDAIITTDSEGIIIDWNIGAQEIFGYLETEISGKKLDIIIPKDNLAQHLKNRERSVQGVGQSVVGKTVELQGLHKNGKEFPIELSLAEWEIPSGKFFTGIVRDITERKHAEEKIRNLAKFPSENPFPILRVAKNGTLLYVNESGKKQLPEWNLQIEHSIPNMLKEVVLNTLNNGEIQQVEFNQSEKTYLFYVIPIFGTEYANLYGWNITEHKQNEAEILMLAHSLKSINECVSITDLEDKILFVNESFLKNYGYAENELIGKQINVVRSLNNSSELVEEILPATIQGEWQGELWNKRKDGSEFIVHLSTTIINDKGGRPLGLIGVASDITSHKKMVNDLLKLSRAVEQSPSSIIITDIKGNIEYVNPKVTDVTGYHFTELQGKNPKIFSSGEKSENDYKILWDTINSGKEWRGEFHNKKKNGELYWESASISAIKNNNEEITHFLAVKEDITERKRAEEAMRESEERYRSVSQSASDAIITTDSKGIIIDWNKGAEKIFGYLKIEITGEKLDIIIPPDYLEKHINGMKRIEQGGEHHIIERTIELQGLHKDGKIFPIELSLAEWESSSKKYFTGIIRDITEKQRAAELLIKSENEFRTLAESMPQIVWITRPDGWNIYFNQQWVDYTGMTLEESYGHGWNTPFHPDDRQQAWDAWQNATKNNGLYSIESRLRRSDGVYNWFLIRGVPMMNAQGTILKWFGTCTDINEIKYAEQELISAKERAEQSDKLKSEFLAQMSHEIRTPLGTIVGNAELLSDSFRKEITPDTLNCFNDIDIATKRIIRTIDLLLNAAELQTSGYKPNFVKVDLNSQVFAKLFQEHQSSANQKGLEFIYKCELKETIILADEYSVYQIFANLIDNAIKYTKKGKVEILLEKNKKGNIITEIKDTGVGINKEFLPRLFDSFAQEEQGYNRKFEGNGLGLSLVKKYCEFNNAVVEVESEKNVGSTFRIIFN